LLESQRGNLTAVASTVSSTVFAYDALGRPTSSGQTTAGPARSFTYTYNADGTLKTQSYPSGRVVAFSYDGAGRPEMAGLGAVGQAEYLQGIDYFPHGAPQSTTLGNNLVETIIVNDRLQPTFITAGSLMSLEFNYGPAADNNGNIHWQEIKRDGSVVGKQYYAYDGVNRLAIAAEGLTLTSDDSCPVDGVPWCRDYVYDAFGNRAATGSMGSGISLGHPAPRNVGQFDPMTNRIDLLPDGSMLDDPNDQNDDPYDAAGNLINHDLIGLMTYDANNKMTSFADGSDSGSYVYDGQGNRVQRLSSTAAGTTTYVYDAFGKLAAEYSTETQGTSFTRKFRTTDHLGSTRLITLAGAVVDPDGGCRDFYPFGERIPGEGTGVRSDDCYKGIDSIAQQFTGKERDAESGLDYFEARYYSSSLGRFNSVDSILHPAQSQAGTDRFLREPERWNKYTYVSNRPLVATDPTIRMHIETTLGLRTGWKMAGFMPPSVVVPRVG